MSKKDYQQIAAVIADNLAITPNIDPHFDEYEAGWNDACEQIARQLAAALRDDNPNFDEEKFLKACGIAAGKEI